MVLQHMDIGPMDIRHIDIRHMDIRHMDIRLMDIWHMDITDRSLARMRQWRGPGGCSPPGRSLNWGVWGRL